MIVTRRTQIIIKKYLNKQNQLFPSIPPHYHNHVAVVNIISYSTLWVTVVHRVYTINYVYSYTAVDNVLRVVASNSFICSN